MAIFHNAESNFPNISTGAIDLVCFGPLTNVAIAMKADGGFSNRIRKYYAMGGNAEAIGNVTISGEFNFWADPEAAYIFLQKVPRPVTLVTWELCYLYSTFSLVNAHLHFSCNFMNIFRI